MGSSASVSKSRFQEWPQFFDLGQEADMKEPVNAEIKGIFPQWVHGSLYRNGTGIFKMGDDQFTHLFDGFAIIHRWSIKNGQVTYRSSLLDSEVYKKCVKYNRLVGDSLGTSFPDPCKTLLERFFSYFIQVPVATDNCSVNIVQHGDILLAMTETGQIHQVNGDMMKSEKRIDLGDLMSIHLGTAHPHFDKEGNMFYYATNPTDPKKCYNFLKVPPPVEGETQISRAQVIASLASRWKFNYGYTHSFGMSENYIVHFELPTALSLPKFLTKGLTGASVADCIVVYENEGINIILADRKTGQRVPVTYLAPHGFVFHFVNCYEEAGHVIADVFLWAEKSPFQSLRLDEIMDHMTRNEKYRGMFARFVLPLNIDEAKPGENLVTLPDSQATAMLRPGKGQVVDVTYDLVFEDPEKYYSELPRFNYDYNTKKYRYVYSGSVFGSKVRKLFKFDLRENKVAEWEAGEHHTTGEPVFLKDPNGTEEDDGVILSPVLADKMGTSSYLVCLDASTFKELGRAVVPPTVKLNYSFHGNFYKRFN